MALIIADRVQETSTTTGTGAFTLGGAVTGFRTFGSVMANTDTIYYTATDQAQSANWEVGVGTWNTGGTLSRTTILASSNAGAAVNFTSGALYIFGTYPASRAVYVDNSGLVTSTGVVPLSEGGTGKTTAPAANAELTGFGSTTTAGGTTTLTNASSYYQVFTGSSNQTIQLPSTATLAQGWSYHLVNNSTGTLTLNTSTAVTLGTIPPGITVMATAQTTSGNTATDWEFGYTDFSTITGTGSVMLNTSPVLGAGAATAGRAPLKFTSGTNLSAVEAGALEYDGTKFFATTGETGSGRSVWDNSYYYYVNATSGAIGAAIADLFASAAFTMQAGGIYMIEWHPYLTKTTAGTLTYTVTTTQTPVSVTAGFINAQSALTASNAAVAGATTTTALPATASIANNAVVYIPVRAFVTANATTGGTVTLRITNSAGTVTLGRGSHIIVRRMPTGTTTGAFA